MRIKDIKEFREFFKTKIRNTNDPCRNVNFIGTFHRKEDNSFEYGFFELYHGYKEKGDADGIKGYLQGFLDMAPDAQAVYEFLQNAVDANSNHFAMFWGTDDEDGEEYLLVLNNGKQFDFAAVSSILNVGVSTKNPEDHTIGKFGIGFKLAHRLVGKDNGLEELIEKNYGPILFSWKNNEISHFLNGSTIEPVPSNQEYEVIPLQNSNEGKCNTDEPWLFKILITNFPCEPGEEIRNVYYKQTSDAFTNHELHKMQAWLRKHNERISLEKYKEGSVFFIRLGEDKKKHLHDANLKEGVKFSLAVLNKTTEKNAQGLKHVILNETEVESEDLNFIDIRIPKASQDFDYIKFGTRDDINEEQQRQKEKDSDVQFLMGFTTPERAEEVFKNAPSFYLYFPLGEEKHKLNFIIHSNAFYKASSRVFLHKETDASFGINERLLEKFAEKLIEQLKQLSSSDSISERLKFLNIYSAILLSDESTEPARQWINRPLVQPLYKYLKENIPVLIEESDTNFQLATDYLNVRIKKTCIPIIPSSLGLKLKWFYWSTDKCLSKTYHKLGLNEFNIIDLLKIKGSHSYINLQLKADNSLVPSLLQELNEKILDEIGYSDDFKENVANLKIFEFKGNNYSIEELKSNAELSQYIIRFETINSIIQLIEKAGFIVSNTNLTNNKKILDYLRRYQSLSYLEYEKLNEFLSEGFEKTQFSILEKREIFKALETPNISLNAKDRNQRMKVLKLFSNQAEDIMPLGQLLKGADKTWLKALCIKRDEDHEDLERYMITSDTDAYTQVVLPKWDKVIEDKLGKIRSIPAIFYQDIVELNKLTKNTLALSNKNIVLIDNSFYSYTDEVFYHSGLASLSDDDYSCLKNIFKTSFNLLLPDKRIISFLKDPPFSLANSTLDKIKLSIEIELSEETAKLLGKVFATCQLPLFEKFAFHNRDYKIYISKKEEKYQIAYIENDSKISDYIKKYHAEIWILPSIKELESLAPLKGQLLLSHLIEACESQNIEQSAELKNILLGKSDSEKKLFLQKFKPFTFNIISENLQPAKLIIELLLSLDEKAFAIDFLTNNLTIQVNEAESFSMSDIAGIGSDTIYFDEEKNYSLLLSEIFKNESLNKGYYIEKVINALSADGRVEKIQLSTLFNLQEETSKKTVLEKLQFRNKHIGYIENPHQLAFYVLYQKLIDQSIKFPLEIADNKGGSIKLQKKIAVSNEVSLFTEDQYLPDSFLFIKDLLKLGEANRSFETSDLELFYTPVISGNAVISPKLKAPLNATQQIELFDILASQFKHGNSLIIDPNWQNILGFDPTSKAAIKYRLSPEEELPSYIYSWFKEESDREIKNKKISFLSALGINFNWSLINKLRTSLLDDFPKEKITVQELSSLQINLIHNTIKFLLRSEQPYIISKDKHFDLIHELYRILLQSIKELIVLPIGIKGESTFKLINFNREQDYYLDEIALKQFEAFGVDKNSLISKIRANFYDATIWPTCQYLKDNLKVPQLSESIFTEKLISLGNEWSDHYYLDWKKKYIAYSIKSVDDIPTQLHCSSVLIKEGVIYDVVGIDNNVYTPKKFSFDEILNKIQSKNLFPQQAILDLKAAFENYKIKVQQLLTEQVVGPPEFQRKVEELKKEFEKEIEKKELKESLQINPYSFKWMIDFIRLEVYQSSDSDRSTPEKEISFFRVEEDKTTERLIILKDPNRTITPSLEFCADFRAIFYHKNGNIINVSIQGASKSGQTAIAMLSNPNELKNVSLNDIKRVELLFSRSIDLLGRLLNSYEYFGRQNQWHPSYCLKENLPEKVQFIFGPPGTGKTTEIAKEIKRIIDHDQNAKILVLTPTNKAADVMVERVLKLMSSDEDWLIRYGNTSSTEIIEKEIVLDANGFSWKAYPKLTLVTTIHRFPYEEFDLGTANGEEHKMRMADMPWDYIIFDEASMIPLSYITYVLHKRKYKVESTETHFYIGGDPLQIPPVIDIPDEDLPTSFDKEQNIYSMIELNSYKEEDQKKIPKFGNKIKNLQIQYRSIECIGNLFSHFSYNGDLKHGRNLDPKLNPNPRLIPDSLIQLGIKPLSIFRFPVNNDDSIFKPEKLRKSPYHLYSAILVHEILKYVIKELKSDAKPWNIGIICPYRSQATLINKMVESLSLPHSISIMTDTVHGFQGDECDIVFFLMSPSSSSISSDSRLFLHKHFLVNVAISRARDYLVILYPDEQTSNISNLEKIHKSKFNSVENLIERLSGSNIQSITTHSSKIEKAIFNDEFHIQKSVFTNKHQLVNVYHEADRDYIIRESSTAIDIQFKS